MEANYFDLSVLNIFLDNEECLGIEGDKIDTENANPTKKITGISIPEFQKVISDADQIKLPLIVRFSDGKEETLIFPFDKYFRLINHIWNHPDYAKSADLITMEQKMKAAAPYNVFFSTLKHCPETKEQLYSISFTDLLCPSLGKLKSTLFITFIGDIEWILTQFALRKLHKLPMTIIHGYNKNIPWPENETMKELYPKIDYHYIEVRKKATDYGFHHSKLSIFIYEDDSLRVVIGSANLYSPDWEIYNQQLWVSPPCPKLPEGSSILSGESPTGFKLALIDYLHSYKMYDIPGIQDWIELVKNADFSDIKVALLFSTPGVHYPRKNGSILHFLGHLLTRDCTIPAPKEEHDSWRIIAQTASLGLVGVDPEEWLTTHLLKALGSHKNLPYLPTLRSVSKTEFSLIFPTVRNVCDGYLGPKGALCCNYEPGVKGAQPWLRKHKCQWKADGTKRTRAMSHSKSYCRISPCWQKMAYYFLASSNLSRSAWGKIPDRDSGTYVRSYEMGVLFLPKYFGEGYFEVKDTPNRINKRLFPIMFDLPLTPYGLDDDSFCWDELVEQGIIQVNSEESKDSENNNLKDNVVNLSATDENKSSSHLKKNDDGQVPPASASHNATKNKWDITAAENTSSTETKKKDMKFNNKPQKELFFPSFNKNT